MVRRIRSPLHGTFVAAGSPPPQRGGREAHRRGDERIESVAGGAGDRLLAIARKKNARIVEDFFPDLPEGPLKETALAIISAWYLGVVTDAPDAEVFAYEYALMYQPTRDVMTIPSYAISGAERLDGRGSSTEQHAGILNAALLARTGGCADGELTTVQTSSWWERASSVA